MVVVPDRLPRFVAVLKVLPPVIRIGVGAATLELLELVELLLRGVVSRDEANLVDRKDVEVVEVSVERAVEGFCCTKESVVDSIVFVFVRMNRTAAECRSVNRF